MTLEEKVSMKQQEIEDLQTELSKLKSKQMSIHSLKILIKTIDKIINNLPSKVYDLTSFDETEIIHTQNGLDIDLVAEMLEKQKERHTQTLNKLLEEE